MTTITEQHARAVQVSVDAVRHATAGDLERQTPCAEWNLGQLLQHMTVQNHGFAAAARGELTDKKDWAVRPLGDDPVTDYAASAAAVTDAFGAPGALDRVLLLPEFSATDTIPGSLAITFHLVDSVVHAWDVARSLGGEVVLDPELADTAVGIARAVPDGDFRLAPESPFRPGLTVDKGDSPIGTIVSLLGRSPLWPN